MTTTTTPATSGGQPAAAEHELDLELRQAIARATRVRQLFYGVVLLVALGGQVSGAVEALHIPLLAAVPAVGALELGGVVVLGNADLRRRLGERATASRLLSAAIAAGAVAFNWLAHANHLLGGFFAGMSALGYAVWLMHTENQRRDRLRAKGQLPPTTPAYELVGHWLPHPWVTRRARSLAKARGLDLYRSLDEARQEIRREQHRAAIAKVLHRKIRAVVDPTVADIAVAVYDLDDIAARLEGLADYDGLTALLATDLDPARLAAAPAGARRRRPAVSAGADRTAVSAGALEAVLAPVAALPTGTGAQPPTGTAPNAAGTGTGGSSGTGRPRRSSGTGTGHLVTIRHPVPVEPGTGKALARAHWDAQVAQGTVPSGAELTRVAGLSAESGLGRRWARDWSRELPASEREGTPRAS
ncbi:MAG TPA: hypothetical protein VJT31_35740 [Rugosimonospora sp.]|nr:hypothetical protein [Rugosimonospora sp.]